MISEKIILFKKKSACYSVQGSGLPVVLIHGFGETGAIWDQLCEFLSSRFRLIIPHLPGSGPSAFNDQIKPEIDEYADYIRTILEEEGIKNCTMAGHSMGGYITLAFAEKYPAMLKAMGLIHSSAMADSPEKILSRKKAINFMNTNGTAAFLKTAIPSLFYDAVKNQKEITELTSPKIPFQTNALVSYYKAMINRPDRRNVLAKTNFPIFFMMGRHDQAVTFEASIQQAYLAENTDAHILRSSAHMGMLEETGKFNLLFGSFLANPTIG